jgi:hypothetical protein
MTWMDKVREAHQVFRDQVRLNALGDEGGLQPVVFLLAGDSVAPVVMTEAAPLQEIYEATDQLAREMGAAAAVLAVEMVARRTDTVEAFRELVEEGVLQPPSKSGEQSRAILWHHFGDGRCETELDVYEGGTWRSHGSRSLKESPVPYFRKVRP